MVINPVTTQMSSKYPDEPTFLAISELTMKIPEPIMVPATIIIASNSLISLLKPDSVIFFLDFEYSRYKKKSKFEINAMLYLKYCSKV